MQAVSQLDLFFHLESSAFPEDREIVVEKLISHRAEERYHGRIFPEYHRF